MSPSLSRENYFLMIINQFDQHKVAAGSLEYEMQQLINEIAENVRAKSSLDKRLLHRINDLFTKYQAIRLKVSVIDSFDNQQDQESDKQKLTQKILLHTEYTKESNHLKQSYMEALISLLEAIEKGYLELQRCMQCNNWYIPYQRAQITKFCGTNCRNRFNYLERKKQLSLSGG